MTLTRRQVSETLEQIVYEAIRHAPDATTTQVLIEAKQAFDILTMIEENLNLNESVVIENRELEWRATRGHRTHLGSDPTDALGQMCTTLALERGLDGDSL